MAIIQFAIFWIIGLFVTSFTILPILIILSFGIPTTTKLEKLNLIKQNNGIISGYFISIFLLGAIFAIMVLVTNSFFPNGIIGILFGGGMTILFGFGQTGINENNVHDYIETNKKHLLITEGEAKYTILGWK